MARFLRIAAGIIGIAFLLPFFFAASAASSLISGTVWSRFFPFLSPDHAFALATALGAAALVAMLFYYHRRKYGRFVMLYLTTLIGILMIYAADMGQSASDYEQIQSALAGAKSEKSNAAERGEFLRMAERFKANSGGQAHEMALFRTISETVKVASPEQVGFLRAVNAGSTIDLIVTGLFAAMAALWTWARSETEKGATRDTRSGKTRQRVRRFLKRLKTAPKTAPAVSKRQPRVSQRDSAPRQNETAHETASGAGEGRPKTANGTRKKRDNKAVKMQMLRDFLSQYPDASLNEMADGIGSSSRETVRRYLHEMNVGWDSERNRWVVP